MSQKYELIASSIETWHEKSVFICMCHICCLVGAMKETALYLEYAWRGGGAEIAGQVWQGWTSPDWTMADGGCKSEL